MAEINYMDLSDRIGSLETHVHKTVTPELRANTLLTAQVHDALFGRGDELGMSAKVEEMHEVFTAAKSGLRVIGSVGSAVVKTVEFIGRVAKPLFWALALAGSIWGFYKTGQFEWPHWDP